MNANANNTKQFGLVTVADIKAPKNTTPGATPGMIVVYSQAYSSAYTTSAGKAAAGVQSGSNDGTRKFSEFWSMAELEQANGGNGLAIGDQLPGISISSLNSQTPFYAGQQAFVDSKGVNRGFYAPVLEFGDQPNDRVAEQTVLTVQAGAPASLEQAAVTAPGAAVPTL